MDSRIPELTEKMQYLYLDIIASLRQIPYEQREYIFGVGDDEDFDWIIAFANYITFEYIKYSYDSNDPEYSLRHFLLESEADDSERMTQSRIMQYVAKYKKREIRERDPGIPPDHKFANLDMDNIEQKLKGYRLTEMNFFEHQVIHDIEIVKAVVEKRIGSAKKISNTRFQEIFEQYDEFVENLIERSKKSDEDMVFASLAFFTLEWHYAFEAFYFAACLMEEHGIKDVDKETLALLCGHATVWSLFGGTATTDSRMIKERPFLIYYLLNPETRQHDAETMKSMIRELLVVYVHYMETVTATDGGLYKDWFKKESSMADWASFLRYYNVFSIWQKKEWTRIRIQNMRKILDVMFIDPI